MDRDARLGGIEEKYMVDGELGRGEFGVTYLCMDRDMRELLACKSISKRKLREAIAVEDVRRQVQNPHNIKYNGTIPGLKYIWRTEGWRGLLKGNRTNCARIAQIQLSSSLFMGKHAEGYVQCISAWIAGAAVNALWMGLLYLIMLVVMSFNVGVLIPAIVGHALRFLVLCEGGTSKEKSLSLLIHRDGNVAFWHCFRVKCGWSGYTKAGDMEEYIVLQRAGSGKALKCHNYIWRTGGAVNY